MRRDVAGRLSLTLYHTITCADICDTLAGRYPKNFTDWAVHNLKRIETARQNGTLPYFLKDNQKYLDKAIPPTLVHLYDVIAKFQYTDPQLAARASEIKAKMLDIFENIDFGMDVPSGYFESIVNDNEFKNQLQVGHSYGKLASQKTTGDIEQDNERLVASHRMFSTADNSLFDLKDGTRGKSTYTGPQLARDEYEKYGHLLDRNETAAFLKQYQLTLNDVQSLVFSRHPNADFPHLVQKLIDKGIEIWYYDDSVKKVVKYKP